MYYKSQTTVHVCMQVHSLKFTILIATKSASEQFVSAHACHSHLQVLRQLRVQVKQAKACYTVLLITFGTRKFMYVHSKGKFNYILRETHHN